MPAKVIGVATEGRPSEEVDQNLRQVLYDKGGSNGMGSKHGNDSSISGGRGGGSGVGGGANVGGVAPGGEAPRRSAGVRGIEKPLKARSFL